MKTAIDWLIEQTKAPDWHSLKRGEIIEIAKEKEKQQIIDAFNQGYREAETEIFEKQKEDIKEYSDLNPTNMLLIDESTINEIKYDDNSVNISHLIGHSKEVEVVDWNKTIKEFCKSGKSNIGNYCNELGYQLIKIKE